MLSGRLVNNRYMFQIFQKQTLQTRQYKTNNSYKLKPKLGNPTELKSYQERRVRNVQGKPIEEDDEAKKNSIELETPEDKDLEKDIYVPYLKSFNMISNSVSFETKYTDIDVLHPSTKDNKVSDEDWEKDKGKVRKLTKNDIDEDIPKFKSHEKKEKVKAKPKRDRSEVKDEIRSKDKGGKRVEFKRRENRITKADKEGIKSVIHGLSENERSSPIEEKKDVGLSLEQRYKRVSLDEILENNENNEEKRPKKHSKQYSKYNKSQRRGYDRNQISI